MKKLLLILTLSFFIAGCSTSSTSSSNSDTTTLSFDESTTPTSSVSDTSIITQEFKVTFDKQNGTGGSDEITVILGQPMPLAIAPERIGYSFMGYFDDSTNGKRYYHADMTSARNWDKEANSTLFAKWNASSFQVTLDRQQGYGGTDKVLVTYDQPMPTAEAPERMGYSFIGYFEFQNGQGKKYYDNDMTSVRLWDMNNEYVLYAYWEEIDNTENLQYTMIEDGVGFAYMVRKKVDNLEGNIIIPAMHKGLPVIEIEVLGFSDCPKILKVIFEGGSNIKTIKDEAFRNCWRLTSIIIPNSVTEMGSGVFRGCGYLTAMSIPFIGSSRNASGKAEALLGWIFGTNSYINSVATTQYYASSSSVIYHMPTTLKTLIISDALLLSYGALSGCSYLTDVTISNTINTMSSSIFRGCGSLTDLTIPFIGQVRNGTGSTMLLGWFFGGNLYSGGIATEQYSASNIVSTYYLPSSLKRVALTNQNTLAYGAFYNCSNIEKITLPDNLLSIKEKAFYNCSKLEEIIIPETVLEILDQAFTGCNKLINLRVESNSESYMSLNGSLYSKDGKHLLRYCPAKPETAFVSPLTLESVEYHAFHNAINLINIEMLGNVNYINYNVFNGCHNLNTLTLPFIGLSRNIASGDWGIFGCVFGGSYDGGTSTMQYTSSVTTATYYLPSTLRRVDITDASYIRYGAFSGCSRLTTINIQGNAIAIEDRAFYDCTGLINLTLPSTIISIGQMAFYNCRSLNSIIINSSITSMGSSAFANWTSGQTIYMRGLSKAPDSWSSSWAKDCNARFVWNYHG